MVLKGEKKRTEKLRDRSFSSRLRPCCVAASRDGDDDINGRNDRALMGTAAIQSHLTYVVQDVLTRKIKAAAEIPSKSFTN